MKKMIKKYRKAKGFTLVELLIVVIIIGILAGMMMLTTGSATDRAEATRIISDMRNVKTAAVLYYMDNGAYPPSETSSGSTASLDKYLDQSRSKQAGRLLVLNTSGTTSGDMYVRVQYDGDNDDRWNEGVASKLDDFAENGVISKDSGKKYIMTIRNLD